MKLNQLIACVGVPCTTSSERKRPIIRLSENWTALTEDVRYLVHDEDEFIVYIDHDMDVYWETSTKWDRHIETKGDPKKHFNVIAQAAVVETTPSDGLSYQRKLQFKRLIGEAIVCSMELQYENALHTLGFARDYLRDRTQEVSRFWYLSSSMMFSVPFICIMIIFWLQRAALIPILGVDPFWLVIAGCFGALGALLSVMSRTGNLAFNSSSGRRLHYLEALSRISVGVLSGILVGLAIRSRLFLSPLYSGPQMHVVMMIAAFAAGAGERLAPSIIAGFDKKAVGPRDDGHRRPD